ncbi:MAG TPA: HEPN domain-containing protein [archaeon]|nr:HEPN domain-containing protein [archaeon]
MKEYDEWFEKARGDLRKAKIMLENKEFDDVAFHCQQAAEKSLKAVLIKQEGAYQKNPRSCAPCKITWHAARAYCQLRKIRQWIYTIKISRSAPKLY